MQTEHVEYLLPEYLDGTLAESLRPGMEDHLKSCSSCNNELVELRRTMEMLHSHRVVEPPDGYFTTVLPRVRERLDQDGWVDFVANPMLIRLVLPIGAAILALFILLSVPLQINEMEPEHNPLKIVMNGSTTDELVDLVLDMVPLQPLSSPTVEGETSSLLGVGVLRGDHLLVDADEGSIAQDLTLDERMPEGLEQLDDADLDALVQRLGERTAL